LLNFYAHLLQTFLVFKKNLADKAERKSSRRPTMESIAERHKRSRRYAGLIEYGIIVSVLSLIAIEGASLIGKLVNAPLMTLAAHLS
jgi:Flp pilus assembly pilin Flp